MAYNTLAQLKEHLGIPSSRTDHDTFLTSCLDRADAYVNLETGTFFTQMTKTYKTQATASKQKKLFLPARIISITSVKEAGVAIAAADFVVYQYWIEKKGGNSWSQLQQDIEVVGSFGFAIVPTDIKLAALEVGGVISGLKIKTFITNEGVEQTVNITTIPTWVKDILEGQKLHNFMGQVWIEA